MKKVFFFLGIAGLFTACDYSVKSNGNIDEAYDHGSTHQIMHEAATEHESSTPHEETHAPAEHKVEPVVSDSTTVQDSIQTDPKNQLEEVHH